MSLKLNNWDKSRIRAQLMLKGVTLRDISLQLKLNKSAASKALNQPWPKVELAIAETIGEAPETIWPTRYDENGNSLKGRVTLKPGKNP